MGVFVENEEVFVSEDGKTLFIIEEKTGNCFELMPKDFIGTIDKQGTYTSVGKFNIEY